MCSADTLCPVRYCSSECQVAAWKRGGHREACRAVRQSAGEERVMHARTGCSLC